jgi:hypothetical protein
MGTEKRQRAIAKRLKRKDAREERKAKERRAGNRRIRAARTGSLFDRALVATFDKLYTPTAPSLPIAMPVPALPSSIWRNIVRRLGL